MEKSSNFTFQSMFICFSAKKSSVHITGLLYGKFTSLCTVFNSSPRSAAYMRQPIGSALVQITACRLFGAKPLSKPMLGYCQLDP